MRKLLVIFEDEKQVQFSPGNLLRPTYFLRCGMTELWVEAKRAFRGYDLWFETATHFESLVNRCTGARVNHFDWSEYDKVVLLNGAVIPDEEFVHVIESCDVDTAIISGDSVGALVVAGNSSTARDYKKLSHKFDKYLPFAESLKNQTKYEFRSFDFLWDLIIQSPDMICRDYEVALDELGSLRETNLAKSLNENELLNKDEIFVHPEATVLPGVVLDATEGPIFIDAEARVEPNSHVIGPFYLGPGSHLLGGKFEGSTVGPVCRVGGELEGSILQGYVNKRHAGFIGHSYVGEWVNFGAMTTNSDLKNNYSNIRVSVGGELIDTGSMKIGSLIGDHTKFGIGTLLTTGISIGAACNIIGGGLISDKAIKSFRWGRTGEWVEHKFEKAIETARRAMARRERDLNDDEITALKILRDLG